MALTLTCFSTQIYLQMAVLYGKACTVAKALILLTGLSAASNIRFAFVVLAQTPPWCTVMPLPVLCCKAITGSVIKRQNKVIHLLLRSHFVAEFFLSVTYGLFRNMMRSNFYVTGFGNAMI